MEKKYAHQKIHILCFMTMIYYPSYSVIVALANGYHSITCNSSVVEIVDAVKSNAVEIQSRKHQLLALNSKAKWDRLKGLTLTLQRNMFVEISAFGLHSKCSPALCKVLTGWNRAHPAMSTEKHEQVINTT